MRSILAVPFAVLTIVVISAQELSIGSPDGVLQGFALRDNLPHGVAGDRDVVFVAEPLVGRVVALSRLTGHEIAVLPPPPEGFVLPFGLDIPEPGRLAVLDPGGLPDPSGPLPIARIVEYTYSFQSGRLNANHRRSVQMPMDFTAERERILSLGGAFIVFADSLESLPDGAYVVSEPIIGALYLVEPSGRVVPAIVPASPEGIRGLAPCIVPGRVANADGIPFRPHGDFWPGVGALEADDIYLYFGNSCTGGVWRVPHAVFRNEQTPSERGVHIELLSPPEPGVIEVMKGLTIDVFGNPDHLYAVDSLGMSVSRIDIDTGARQELARDGRLLDFPVSATFIPPYGSSDRSPLVIVSDQEHRWTALNAGITGDMFRLPFTMASLVPRR